MMRAHIVLIDDDLALQLVTTAALQTRGYRLTAVSPGDSAAIPPDADLLLLHLPSITDLAHYLPQQVPIIALVANHQAGANALAAGADDYLCKPFNQTELLIRVQTQLRVQELVADNQRLQAELRDLRQEQAEPEA